MSHINQPVNPYQVMDRVRRSSGSAAKEVPTLLSNPGIARYFRKDCFMNLLDVDDDCEHSHIFNSKVTEEFFYRFLSAIEIIE